MKGPISLPDAELEAHLEKRAEKRSTKNPLEVFGLPATATAVEVRRAYLQAAKDYHPYRFTDRSDRIQSLVIELFIMLNKAHSQFRTAQHKAERRAARRAKRSESPPKPVLADGSGAMQRPGSPERERLRKFARASAHLKKQEFAAAVRVLEQLVQACPKSRHYRVFHHFAQGQAAIQEGDYLTAARQFDAALDLDENFAPAKKALEAMNAAALRR